ncbi:MAG TPA: carboxypeptidase regulatory-like domain-containing protein [Vicinamibacterales bacterium]|jgi:Carboxypeptidase regulatory-like domain|nr:carboxypeptidase regulatory-like domain-containing protein [Vicinamibacterales bacterium]
MTRSRIAMLFAVALGCLALPATARAQSAFAGVVKDATGAVLPGVTVEASSPALIEKVRSVTTDANGLYRIENLRPGTYTITFNLPGFSAVKRDGVELPSNFTSTINADLKVGAMEETVTVSGQSPVVDVQSNSKAQVLSREVLDAVPTAHTIQGVGQLVVGVTLTAPDVGGSQAMQQTYFTVHGLGAAQTSLMMDGMIINGLQGDGAIQTYTNDAGNQEMVYQTGGGTVDSPTGGVKINMIPREGGNRVSGSLFQGYETSKMQGNNLSDFLAANGVKTVDKIGTYNDTNATFGGPVMKDKLWYFGSVRFFIVNKPIANTYVSDGTKAGILACANALAGRGGSLCPQGTDDQHQYSGLARMTWQISPRNKLAGYYDRIHKVRGAAMNPGDDQTTSSVRWNSPLYTTNMLKYTSTVTSKFMLEGGFSSNLERYNNLYADGVEQPYGSAAWFSNARRNVDAGGSTNTASTAEYGSYPDRYNMQASASYITGSQAFKVGFQDSWGPYNQNLRANADLYQNYTTSATTGLPVPSTVTLLATSPLTVWQDKLNANLGFYGQDVLTFKRATITLGGRYEYISEQVTGQQAQTGRFATIPAFGDIQMPTWKSFSPRTSIVYDLMGNGKTAVRFGYNRFGVAATTTLASLYDPANGVNITTTAPWTDKNGDDIAQGSNRCNFADPTCEINFASVPANFGVISLASPDPNLTRPYVDQFNVGATHEVMRGVSVSGEWFHNDARNSWERNNILRPGTYSNGVVTNPSYKAVTVFSPIDGRAITMYDTVSTAVAGAVQNVDTNDSNVKQSYNAFEFNFNARLPHGARLFGGTATDRTIANTCAAAATNPNFLVTIGGVNYCDQTNSGIPWRTQFKLAGTFPLPWYGITAAASFQALPGYILGTSALTAGGAGAPNFTSYSGVATSWTVTGTTNYTVCPGNSASQGCVVGARVVPAGINSGTFTVPLDAPGTLLTPRVNQLDLSFSKRITVAGVKLDPKIDIFNALNSDDYFTVRSTTFSPTTNAALTTPVTRGSAGTYLQPGSILQGRIIRLGAVITW